MRIPFRRSGPTLPGREDLPDVRRPHIELRRPELGDLPHPEVPDFGDLRDRARARVAQLSVPEIPQFEIRRRRRRSPLVPAALAALGAAAGAALLYFFDPERGRSRRAQTIDRVAGFVRRSAREATRAGRKVTSDAAGLGQRLTRGGRGNGVPANDADLAHRVETELFRDPTVPKGSINVNAESGVVVLRGVVESTEQINEIESRVLKVDGVYAVRNLLHLAESPAPMQTGTGGTTTA